MRLTRSGKRDGSPLSLAVSACRGVGPKTGLVLHKIGVSTVGELLYHFPRAYLDRRNIVPIGSVRASQPAVVRGEVTRVRCFRPLRRLHITQCLVSDGTGSLKVVWFNQPYIRRNLPAGANVILSGSVLERRGLQMENPDVEPMSGEEHDFLHTMGLVPVYPLTEGLGQKRLRRLVHDALEDFLDGIPENLPAGVIDAHGLVSRKDALRAIHFPHVSEESETARRRIAFEEFLALQLSIQSAAGGEYGGGIAHNSAPSLTSRLDSCIPFRPTRAQQRAITEIFARMESPRQMNVLLQGDVGSGKTVVAAYSMLKAIENGKQAILMAPTEVLAEQHLSSLRELLRGIELRTALLSGSRSTPEKERALKLLASGTPSLIVGTHALIQKKVSIPNAGLVIIDEQHRFGVSQRAALREKGVSPDLIVMTATPIPRTLALALYGNFETIVIDECPPGRHPVETRHVSESERGQVCQFVREEISGGRQAFVVCPEIGEQRVPAGAPRGDAGRTAATASRTYADYKKLFSELSVALLHGRMRPEDREKTLLRFRRNEAQILVATTIVEVGVDVPNASVMIVESADRFGLAQLHQLRGRVGRSHHKSRCFLMAEPSTPEAVRRLEIMVSTNDGFAIAEHDMLLRGPGEFLGTAQSGLPPLRVGHLVRDAQLLERAREAAAAILDADPRLESSENAPLRLMLDKPLPEAVHL